jgi:hypothetical protein
MGFPLAGTHDFLNQGPMTGVFSTQDNPFMANSWATSGDMKNMMVFTRLYIGLEMFTSMFSSNSIGTSGTGVGRCGKAL